MFFFASLFDVQKQSVCRALFESSVKIEISNRNIYGKEISIYYETHLQLPCYDNVPGVDVCGVFVCSHRDTICLCEFRNILCKCINSKRLFRSLFNACFFLSFFFVPFLAHIFFRAMPTINSNRNTHTHISVVDFIQY